MRVINFKGGGAFRYGVQYEFDKTIGGTKEKLYLCGDAYSAVAAQVVLREVLLLGWH